jgi:hypothetical protein
MHFYWASCHFVPYMSKLLFSAVLKQCSLLSDRDKVSHPYETELCSFIFQSLSF